jgi:rhamnosyltransferase subunit B
MAEIVVGTTGTWGDIFPAVGLAKGLIDAGHTIRVAAPPSYRVLVEGEGLSFSPIGPPLGFAEYAADPKILSGRLGGFAGFLHLFREFIFPNLDRYVADLTESISDADLLLAHPGLIAAPIAAEVARVKWGTVSVFPGLIPTSHTPPLATRIPSPPGSLGCAFHRLAWKFARVNMARVFDPPVNRARRHFGLAPTSNSFFAPVECGGPYLILASPAVVDRPPDWPEQVQLTGFVTWDRVSSWQEPDGLTDFLSGPELPILVTLGASSSLDPQGFYDHAAKAVAQLGHRALILTGPTPTPIHLPSNDLVFSAPFAPLSVVAARCRAAVHHGGVGTTVELLEAGIPQLVVPRGFDQPQTAGRVTKLGVARTLPWRKASSQNLRRELDALLADQRYSQNAATLQAKLADEDGLAQSVDAVNAALS